MCMPGPRLLRFGLKRLPVCESVARFLGDLVSKLVFESTKWGVRVSICFLHASGPLKPVGCNGSLSESLEKTGLARGQIFLFALKQVFPGWLSWREPTAGSD